MQRLQSKNSLLDHHAPVISLEEKHEQGEEVSLVQENKTNIK